MTPLWVVAFKALGAAAATINLPELYSSLQTKIVDGQENPLVQINAFRLYEVQKYCAMTGHVWDGGLTVANATEMASHPEGTAGGHYPQLRRDRRQAAGRHLQDEQ